MIWVHWFYFKIYRNFWAPGHGCPGNISLPEQRSAGRGKVKNVALL